MFEPQNTIAIVCGVVGSARAETHLPPCELGSRPAPRPGVCESESESEVLIPWMSDSSRVQYCTCHALEQLRPRESTSFIWPLHGLIMQQLLKGSLLRPVCV